MPFQPLYLVRTRFHDRSDSTITERTWRVHEPHSDSGHIAATTSSHDLRLKYIPGPDTADSATSWSYRLHLRRHAEGTHRLCILQLDNGPSLSILRHTALIIERGTRAPSRDSEGTWTAGGEVIGVRRPGVGSRGGERR
jgi:hypothetical protein